jgi:hypothetical protein
VDIMVKEKRDMTSWQKKQPRCLAVLWSSRVALVGCNRGGDSTASSGKPRIALVRRR